MACRVWLHIKALRVFALAWNSEHTGIHFSVDYGPFVMHNGTAALEKDRLTFNMAASSGRFLDIPGIHRGENANWPILSMVMIKAIALGASDYFQSFILGQTKETSFGPWEPEGWGGMKIAIPIDFISVEGLERSESGSCASVILGRHVVLWRVPIYSQGTFSLDDEKVLIDARGTAHPLAPLPKDGLIAELLRSMWDRIPNFKQAAYGVTASMMSEFDFDSVFTLAAPGIVVDRRNLGLPPQLHMWDGENHVPAEKSIGF
jgi:hypothetical protein